MTTNTKQQTAIDRAKAKAEQWEAQADEWRSRPSFLHLPPIELIELAENTKALDIYELEALEEAWLAMFGETLDLFAPVAQGSAAASAVPEASDRGPEPKDDEPVTGWKPAARLAGVHHSTLRREVLAGRFPRPRRISDRRVGWPASEIKEWRDQLDAKRLRGSGR